MLGQVAEHRPRVDLAVLQVLRHPAGGIEVRAVAVLGVRREAVVAEGAPAGQRRLLTRGHAVVLRSRSRRLTRDPRRQASESGCGAGSGPTRSRQARENGVNTWYGVPAAVRIRPGSAAQAVPVPTSRRPEAASRSATRASRRRPNGVDSRLTCTSPAPTSSARAGTTSVGSPVRTTSAPSVASCPLANTKAAKLPGCVQPISRAWDVPRKNLWILTPVDSKTMRSDVAVGTRRASLIFLGQPTGSGKSGIGILKIQSGCRHSEKIDQIDR